ncbi:MAG: inositol-3-phosphate synthase [Candidatus Korarchaeum sp.]
MPKVRVAFVGVGNVTSAVVQGMHYYRSYPMAEGLWHPSVGGFTLEDIEVVAAFDVDERKVGKDLSEAIFSEPNSLARRVDVPRMGVEVRRGFLKDELNPHMASSLKVVCGSYQDFLEALESSGADVVVNSISSGLDETSKAYAMASREAGASFVNLTPSAVATDDEVERGFFESGLVVAGDDLMSQVGGTAFHKGLASFLKLRGVKPMKSYQLDVGGGLETVNTMYEDLRIYKRTVKSSAIAAEFGEGWEIIAGTSDYVDFLGNDRVIHLYFVGSGFMGSEISIEVAMRANDGMNAGNVVLDLIRAVARAKLDGKRGYVDEICEYGFKRTRRWRSIVEATRNFELSYCR